MSQQQPDDDTDDYVYNDELLPSVNCTGEIYNIFCLPNVPLSNSSVSQTPTVTPPAAPGSQLIRADPSTKITSPPRLQQLLLPPTLHHTTVVAPTSSGEGRVWQNRLRARRQPAPAEVVNGASPRKVFCFWLHKPKTTTCSW